MHDGRPIGHDGADSVRSVTLHDERADVDAAADLAGLTARTTAARLVRLARGSATRHVALAAIAVRRSCWTDLPALAAIHRVVVEPGARPAAAADRVPRPHAARRSTLHCLRATRTGIAAVLARGTSAAVACGAGAGTTYSASACGLATRTGHRTSTASRGGPAVRGCGRASTATATAGDRASPAARVQACASLRAG